MGHYEVIVSDDGQGFQAEAFCREHYPWVCYTHGPQKGPAANRNHGARLATGEWLVFTDDDCLPDGGWLQAYADAIQQYPECKAFEGAVLPDDWDLLKKDMAECPVNTGGGCFWSANIMVHLSTFKEVGGFDEAFLLAANEDQQLFLLVKKANEVKFIKGAKIFHPVRLNSLLQRFLKSLPLLKSWIIYEEKQNSPFIFIYLKGIKSQVISFINALKNLKVKKSIEHLYGILLQVFIAPLIYLKIRINKKEGKL